MKRKPHRISFTVTCCLSIAIAALYALALCGCQSQPSRSQTLTIKACTINLIGATNGCPLVAGDLWCQAMAIETRGSETQSAGQRVDPSVDVTAPAGPLAEGIRAVGKVGVEAVKASASKAGSGASAAEADCPDGNCRGGADCPDCGGGAGR